MRNFIFFVVIAAVSSLPAQARSRYSTGSSSTVHSSTHRAEVSSDSYGSDRYNTYDYNFLGLQSGMGLAMVSMNQTPGAVPQNNDSRLRFNVGGYYERRFIPYVGLRVEFDYNQRGFSTSDGQGLGATTQSYSVNYLEFPLMAKAQIPIRWFTPYVLAGPFVGVAVARTRTDSAGGQSQDTPIDNTVNSFNFGLNFGGGATFEVVRHFNLELGIRYSMGLINVVADPLPGASVKLNSLEFMSGVAYSI
jgi:opacity protein-like surface antigen